MRTFARYNTHLPVEIAMQNTETERLASISYGGMQLDSDIPMEIGQTFDFSLPIISPEFHTLGKIKWNRNAGDHYDVGVEFIKPDKAVTEILVEQVYYIEQYYKEALKQGRKISIEDAADEWKEEQRYL